MENKKRNIDDLLREGLGSYTETPPPDIWASLDKRLPSGPSRGFVFPYWGWLVILLFAGGVAGSYQWLHQSNPSPAATKEQQAVALNSTRSSSTTNQKITPTPQAPVLQAPTSAPSIAAAPAARQSLAFIPGSSNARHKQNRNIVLPQLVYRGPVVAVNELQIPVPNASAEAPVPRVQHVPAPAKIEQHEPTLNPLAMAAEPVKAEIPEKQEIQRNKKSLPIEAGIKAGYEMGFQDDHVNKVVLGGFVGVKLSRKVSLQMSPTYQFGSITGTLFSSGNYYHINTTRVDSLTIQDTQGNKTYRYKPYQNYDSIAVIRQMKTKQLWEITLPLLVRYAITKRLTVFAGPSVTFSNRPAVTETKNTVAGLVVSDSMTLKAQVPYSRFNELFTRSGQPIDSLPPLNEERPSPVRLGYQAGLAYEYSRFQAEVMVQQQLSGTGNVSAEQLKQIYKQPYIRIMLGYKLLTYKHRRK